MANDGPPAEKRIRKDTAAITQFRESVAVEKKRRETLERNKELKAQGVGSTIPASRRASQTAAQLAKSQGGDAELSADEDYDVTLAEIQAEEARVNALRAKLAKRDGLRFKDLKLMDETELERLWDNGGKSKGTTVPAQPKPSGSKVQSAGPAQQILTSPARTSIQRASAKRKRSTPPAPRSTQSKPGNKQDSKSSRGTRGSDSDEASGRESPSDGGDSDVEDKSDPESGSEGTGGSDPGEDPVASALKSKKASGSGKKGRGKTSDFKGTAKKMVDFTTVRACAKLAATGMFCSPQRYKSIVKQCWVHAAAEYGVDHRNPKYTLSKAHKQAIRSRVNSFRSRIRDRFRPAIPSAYKLLTDGLSAEEVKRRVKKWIPHAFHTMVGAPPKTGHFQHDFLQDAVFEAFYTGNNPVGIVYAKWFDPMPLEAIALVCAVIRWVIQQHESGKYVKVKMSFEKLREYYEELMDSLTAFKNGRQGQRCACVQEMLHLVSMERAGCAVSQDEPKVADALGEDDFAEDMPTADELKKIAQRRKSRNYRDTPQQPDRSAERESTNPNPARTTPAASPNINNNASQPSITAVRITMLDDTTDEGQADEEPDNGASRTRFSSVSLDHEEPEDSRKSTPTPPSRPHTHSQRQCSRPSASQVDHEEEEGEDDTTDEEEEEEEEEEMDVQPPPKKKQKSDKSTGSTQVVLTQTSGKLTPAAARASGKLLLSQPKSSRKNKSKGNLKLQCFSMCKYTLVLFTVMFPT